MRADPVTSDAAPPVEISSKRILRQGAVIDLDEARIVAKIGSEPPQLEDGSYFVDKTGAIHAIDLATATERWSRKPASIPYMLASTDRGAVTGRDKALTLYDHQGSERSIAFAATVGHLAARAHDVVFVESGQLQRIDPASGGPVILAKVPFDLSGYRSKLQLLPDGRSVCAIAIPIGALEIACFDGEGKPGLRSTIDLHEPADPKGMSFSIRSIDERYVLYGVGPFFVGPVSRSAIVRLADGAIVAKLPENIAAIVEREDGSIEGLLAVQPELRMFEIGGKLRWKAPSPNAHDEGASAIAREGRVYVDVFPPISSGSALLALDAKTGTTVWQGDVHMLPIGHSEYFNDVRISFAGARVVLRGDESSVWTFQLFDARTGKRDFFDSRSTW